MRFASLGSGSRGNATLIEQGTTRILVDSGFSAKELEARLGRLGCDPASITAVLVTHEHNDHIGGVGVFSRRFDIPVWMTTGTLNGHGDSYPHVNLFSPHESFSVGDIAVEPFPVPHDAREPCQFILSDGGVRLGMLTDVGRSTQHIETLLSGCDALMLECNHDSEMLANGPYPPSLKRRVGGEHGHLSNVQAANLLQRLDVSRLQHIVAAHLSEKNNAPELAIAALAGVLNCEADWITVAEQDGGFDWRTIA